MEGKYLYFPHQKKKIFLSMLQELPLTGQSKKGGFTGIQKISEIAEPEQF